MKMICLSNITRLGKSRYLSPYKRNRYYHKKTSPEEVDNAVRSLLEESKNKRRKGVAVLRGGDKELAADVLISLSKKLNNPEKMSKFISVGLDHVDICNIINRAIVRNKDWRSDGWDQIVKNILITNIASGISIPLIGSLPIQKAPDYAVPLSKIDPVFSQYNTWKSIETDYFNSSEIGELIDLALSHNTSQVPKAIVDVITNHYIKSEDDIEHSLHAGNVMLAKVVGSKGLKNTDIGNALYLYNSQIITYLKKEGLAITPTFYIGWLALLIAETANRRGKQYHDVLLIKHLLDRLMADWPHSEIQKCSDIIAKKFTIANWFGGNNNLGGIIRNFFK